MLAPDQEILTSIHKMPREHRGIEGLFPEWVLGVALHTGPSIGSPPIETLPVGRPNSRDRQERADEFDGRAISVSEDEGFVFNRLGQLQWYAPNRSKEVTKFNVGTGKWTKTYGAVVINIGRSGKAGGVWLMLSFSHKNCEEDRMEHDRPKDDRLR